MNVLLLVELILVIIIGAQHIIRLHKFESRGLAIRQVALAKAGRIMSLLGSAAVILVPRLLNGRYSVDDKSGLIYFVVTTLSFCGFIVGVQFQVAAFKEQHETPNWIRQIATFWR